MLQNIEMEGRSDEPAVLPPERPIAGDEPLPQPGAEQVVQAGVFGNVVGVFSEDRGHCGGVVEVHHALEAVYPEAKHFGEVLHPLDEGYKSLVPQKVVLQKVPCRE